MTVAHRCSLLVVLASLVIPIQARALPTAVVPATPTGVAVGFDNPETAVWDARTGAWYVSNNGITGGKGGYISKLKPGEMQPTTFATGLRGPQGIEIFGHTIIAADGANVVYIDMDDPTRQTKVNVGGSGDLDVDPATGDVYVGNLSTGVINRIHEGVVEKFTTVSMVDGVEFRNGALYVCTLRPNSMDSGIYRIDLGSKQITTVATIRFGSLDGLEQDGDGWLTTDFVRGQLYHVGSDGALTLLAQVTPSSAQIGFDPATRTVAVPELAGTEVFFFKI